MLLRLTSDSLPFWVNVDLRDYNGRWVAVADLAGERELGLGVFAREAVLDAVAALRREDREGLVVDLARKLRAQNDDGAQPHP
ncbi:MAG: hypothetical protein ABI725_01225 [Chloroflexota bacterium]